MITTSAIHGKPVGDHEQDHGRVDHQPVGERVGDLPEVALDVPAAARASRRAGRSRRRRRRRSRPASEWPPVGRATSRTMKTGTRTSRQIVSAFGSSVAPGRGRREMPGRGGFATRLRERIR